MDTLTNYDAPSPTVSRHSSGQESEFNKSNTSVKASSCDTIRDSESTGEIITRFELDIACICEKLTNLNLLLMHVETKEIDFEAFASDIDPDLVVKALELDLLCGILDSEVRVLETHVSYLQTDKANVSEFISSRKPLGEPLVAMEDMLRDSEKSLEQSMEQILEIKLRAANFAKNLSRFSGDEVYIESSNNDDNLELKEKMKMQNVEHKRHILRMLEKSLERELDMERKVGESTQIEEGLTMRLRLSEQEVRYAEEEAEIALEKFYESDHTSDLLMETSRELLSQIKMLQFNLNGSVQRESELKTALSKLKEQITEYELQLIDKKASTELENTINELRQQIIEKERNLVKAAAMCQQLNDAYKKVEKELNDTKIKLQHSEACYEASQEEKTMLHSTVKDMQNVIDELKKKVSKAEIQTENVEDKCIYLSESNADLKKELNFAKSRIKCLETSLHQTEETKKSTAKDISLRTKLITDLVMQMTHERERLQKQISSLKQENKSLVKRLDKTEKESLSNNFESENVMGPTESVSEIQTERNIDIWELNRKYIRLLLLILIIPLLGVLLYQTQVR